MRRRASKFQKKLGVVLQGPFENSTKAVQKYKQKLSTTVDNFYAFCGILFKKAGFWVVFTQVFINKMWITLFFMWITIKIIHILIKIISAKSHDIHHKIMLY